MKQTPATKMALARDKYRCQWCFYKNNIRRDVFQPVSGYPRSMGGGHHVFGRAKVDVPEAIIALCCEHHWKIHNARLNRCELIELLEWITGIPLRERYREFHNCRDGDTPAADDPDRAAVELDSQKVTRVMVGEDARADPVFHFRGSFCILVDTLPGVRPVGVTMPRGFSPSRKDLSQPEIERALRLNGWRVCDTHALGENAPDLFASKFGVTVAVECKTGKLRPKPHQIAWADSWLGFYAWGSDPDDIVLQCEEFLAMAYREPVFRKNGFKTHREFVETVRWLVSCDMKQADVGRLYHVTRAYVNKITRDHTPEHPLHHQARPEEGAREIRDTQEPGKVLDSSQIVAG